MAATKGHNSVFTLEIQSLRWLRFLLFRSGSAMSEASVVPNSSTETGTTATGPESPEARLSSSQSQSRPIPAPSERVSEADSKCDDATIRTGEPESHFWLRRSDQLFVGIVALIALVLMAWHWARLSGWGMQPVEIDRHPRQWLEYKLDINSATPIEWAQLAGIGETLARRIVDDRARNGPFESIDDLQRVKGIGPKTVERIRPHLTVNPVANDGRRRATTALK
jgi:competence protein ComEA